MRNQERSAPPQNASQERTVTARLKIWRLREQKALCVLVIGVLIIPLIQRLIWQLLHPIHPTASGLDVFIRWKSKWEVSGRFGVAGRMAAKKGSGWLEGCMNKLQPHHYCVLKNQQ